VEREYLADMECNEKGKVLMKFDIPGSENLLGLKVQKLISLLAIRVA